MSDINIPVEILQRIKELKVSNCIISKKPQKPIQLTYRNKKGVINEYFNYNNLQSSFIIEVFSDGNDLKLFLTNSS
tara:strand:+ start:926 stop:1153 length:228 start_codon:yes stop_codon:yes gene_type:complete